MDLSKLGDIGLSPARREFTQKNKPPKPYAKIGGAVHKQFFKKGGNMPSGSVPP